MPAYLGTSRTLTQYRQAPFQGAQLASLVDPLAAAFFAEQIALGQTLSTTEKNATNSLCVALRNFGLLPKLTFPIYPLVGGTATSHSVNLIDPSANQIIWHGTVVHNSAGITGDGSTGYGDTGLLPETVGANGGMSSYVNVIGTNPNENVSGSELSDGSEAYYINLTNAGVYYGAWGQSNIAESFTAPTAGMFSINRTSGTALRLDKNGTQVASSSTATTPSATGFSFFVLGINQGGGLSLASNATLALQAYHQGLSSTDSANFYTAVQAFQTTLGRQI